MRAGDYVETPKFGRVKVENVLDAYDAHVQGYKEPTLYEGEYNIFGKPAEDNQMVFAAVEKSDGELAAAIMLAMARRAK